MRTSGYSYTKAMKKRRRGGRQAEAEYRMECAQGVLDYWSNMMEDFYAGIEPGNDPSTSVAQ
jgi:hypothetical protein